MGIVFQKRSEKMKITIDYKFVSLNEYIQAERGNKFAAANIKSKETKAVEYYAVGKKWLKFPCKVIFTWHLSNKRKDIDNTSFARKFILDGLVKAEVIPDDNLRYIQGLEDKIVFDDRDYVEIEFEEME